MKKYILLPSSSVFMGRLMALKIISKDFVDNGDMPKEFTCRERNISPELHWSDVPENAKSLVLLIFADPDAPILPSGVADHWVIYNLPVDSKGLPSAM